jgi:hypothetical protein
MSIDEREDFGSTSTLEITHSTGDEFKVMKIKDDEHNDDDGGDELVDIKEPLSVLNRRSGADKKLNFSSYTDIETRISNQNDVLMRLQRQKVLNQSQNAKVESFLYIYIYICKISFSGILIARTRG